LSDPHPFSGTDGNRTRDILLAKQKQISSIATEAGGFPFQRPVFRSPKIPDKSQDYVLPCVAAVNLRNRICEIRWLLVIGCSSVLGMGHHRIEQSSTESSAPERLSSKEDSPKETRVTFASSLSSRWPVSGGASGLRAAALGLQAKLAVGGTNDPAEKEADAVAAEVVARIRRSDGGVVPPEVNRSPAQRIRRDAVVGSEGGPADSDTEQRIQARRGGGSPLPADMAEQMGAGFGADFSAVRLHTGAESAELNDRLQARAFTVGSDVFLGSGADVRSGDGQQLLAHELTHTIQQSETGAVQRLGLVHRKELVQRDDVPRSPEQEAEAKTEFIDHFASIFGDVTWLQTTDGWKNARQTAEMVWAKMYETLAKTAPRMEKLPKVSGTEFSELTIKGDRYKPSSSGESQIVLQSNPEYKKALAAAEEFATMLKDLTKQSPEAKKIAKNGFAFWSGQPAKKAAGQSGLQSLEGSQLGGMFEETKIPEGTDMSIWGSISKSYAEWATEGMDTKGNYKGFVGTGGDRLDSIYNSVERWAFQKGREGEMAGISFTLRWHAVVPHQEAYEVAARKEAESGGKKQWIERESYKKGAFASGGSDVGPVDGFNSRVQAEDAMRTADAARRATTGKQPD
jgi:hypothetical protein